MGILKNNKKNTFMKNFDKEIRDFAVKHQGINGNTYDQYSSIYNYMITPNIIEERKMNVVAMDVFSRLMMDRIIFLGVPINDDVANIITAQLLFLESLDASKDIQIYINSPGGGVYAGLGIYDTMQYIKPDVSTISIGLSASMGALILAAGAKGKRYALPNSEILLHQVAGGARGQATEIEITAKQILKIKERMNKILAKHTGQPLSKISKDTDRDFYLTADEAKEYGVVDKVLLGKK